MSNERGIALAAGLLVLWDWTKKPGLTPRVRTDGAGAALRALPTGLCGAPSASTRPGGSRGGNLAADGTGQSFIDALGAQRQGLVLHFGNLASGRPAVPLACAAAWLSLWVDVLSAQVRGDLGDAWKGYKRSASRLSATALDVAAAGLFPEEAIAQDDHIEALRALDDAIALRSIVAVLASSTPDRVSSVYADLAFERLKRCAFTWDVASTAFGDVFGEARAELAEDLSPDAVAARGLGLVGRILAGTASALVGIPWPLLAAGGIGYLLWRR